MRVEKTFKNIEYNVIAKSHTKVEKRISAMVVECTGKKKGVMIQTLPSRGTGIQVL